MSSDSNNNGVLVHENEEAAAKHPRGRPPLVTVEPENDSASYVIEVAPGIDVVACLVNFAKAKWVGLTILHALGSVNGVISFRHGGQISGYFDIVSFHGTMMYPFGPYYQPCLTMMMTPKPPGDLVGEIVTEPIIGAGPPGNLVGGIVTGPIIGTGPILVTARKLPTSTFRLEKTASGSGNMSAALSGCWIEKPLFTPHGVRLVSKANDIFMVEWKGYPT